MKFVQRRRRKAAPDTKYLKNVPEAAVAKVGTFAHLAAGGDPRGRVGAHIHRGRRSDGGGSGLLRLLGRRGDVVDSLRHVLSSMSLVTWWEMFVRES